MTRSEPLPISPLLPQILEAARVRPVVVSAPTGSGKSTCVPATLTALGRVLVVEPRRVACRALAARVAELRGVRPGTDVGWIVKDEREVADDAAITFVTPGVALRLVQSGDVDAFGAVVLDEFHERAFDTDLLLALLQTRRASQTERPARPAQALIVMSATLQADRVARHIDGVHLEGHGRTFPITTRWQPGDASVPTKRGLEDRLLAALDAAADDPGDVLVFLPGKVEIARAADAVRARHGARLDVRILHGEMTLREQSELLDPRRAPGARRRVVLATNVAETSLTIPGVGVVIDSGLVRGMVYRAGRGYLSLQPVARDAADQRAGRAGRLGPGVCIRLWSPKAALDDVTTPEIHRGSLVSLTLAALACSPRGMDLPWLDRPRTFAVEAALAELTALGCVARGAITPNGRRLFALPLDVGLARLLTAGDAVPGLAEPSLLLAAALSASRSLFRRSAPDAQGPWRAAPRASHDFAVTSEDDLRSAGCDVVALIEAVRRGDAAQHGLDPKALSEARAAASRFRKLGFGDPGWSGALARRPFAELLIRIWPGSAHVRRDQKRGRFTWAAGGTEMELDPESALRQSDHEALIVLDSRAVAAQPGQSGLVITAAMPVAVAWLAAAGLGEDHHGRPDLVDGRVVVTVTRSYAGRELSTREETPSGAPARVAIRDLILANRLMKGAAERLKERHELAGLALQVALTDRTRPASAALPAPLPPLPEWLLGRLEAVGLESCADLPLLSIADLLPPEPDPEVARVIERNYPKTLNVNGTRYRIAYQLSDRTAVFHQVAGQSSAPPSTTHLPALPGLRLYWEHKNRVQPIPGRA
jgi:ATP-dependent helicase HrpB